MKTTPVCPILVSLLAFSPLVIAEDRGPARDGERPGERSGKRPPRGAEMWKKVDRDQDGTISPDEFAQMPRLNKLPEDKRQALFERLDKNEDGGIDRTEMHQGKPAPTDGRPNMPQIWELDKNRDGGVSFEEFQTGKLFQRLDPERQKRLFGHLDSNGDGKITPEDKPKRRERPDEGGERLGPRPNGGDDRKPGKPQPGGIIQHLDKNGDGWVSPEEFAANPRMKELDAEMIRKRFQMMDRNGDGKLDRGDMQRRDGQRPKPDGQWPKPRHRGPGKPQSGPDGAPSGEPRIE